MSNRNYDPVVRRMRSHTYTLFNSIFKHEGVCSNTHDWRLREYNSAPDLVCNFVLDTQTSTTAVDN